MKLVSMKLSDEEKKEQAGPTALADQPEYGYGTQIRLEDDQMSALGMASLPAVGQTMMIQARVKVMSVSQNDSVDGDKESCVSLQITDMAIGPDKEPAPEAKAVLYKGN